MNKKINTLLFVLGATLFNILVAIISFILFALFFSKFVITPIPEWLIMLIFLASIAVSFLVYRSVIKYLTGKINIEKYFDPIFTGRKNRKS
jgi:amino acid transporter